jgi:hypothetical protein
MQQPSITDHEEIETERERERGREINFFQIFKMLWNLQGMGILILYYVTSRFATNLKSLDSSLEGCTVLVQTAHLTFIAKIKNAVFWDVTPCSSCKNRRFGGT